MIFIFNKLSKKINESEILNKLRIKEAKIKNENNGYRENRTIGIVWKKKLQNLWKIYVYIESRENWEIGRLKKIGKMGKLLKLSTLFKIVHLWYGMDIRYEVQRYLRWPEP